jgi:hypothetical protein
MVSRKTTLSAGALLSTLDNSVGRDNAAVKKAAGWPRPGNVADPRQSQPGGDSVCRNIKTLFNFEPPATDDEIRAASLQFVRKLSGFNQPSKLNEAIFNDSVEEVAAIARQLIDGLVTGAPFRDRAVEAEKAKARSAERFGRPDANR